MVRIDLQTRWATENKISLSPRASPSIDFGFSSYIRARQGDGDGEAASSALGAGGDEMEEESEDESEEESEYESEYESEEESGEFSR